jgi:hypothetical protein
LSSAQGFYWFLLSWLRSWWVLTHFPCELVLQEL